jgi:hypothetical protein
MHIQIDRWWEKYHDAYRGKGACRVIYLFQPSISSLLWELFMPCEFVEKRNYSRVPLDLLLYITLRLDDGSEMLMQLVDCGRGGLQLGFPADKEPAGGLLNRKVTAINLPLAMDMEGAGVPGVVVWVGSGRCGLRFDAPLGVTDSALQEIVRNL